MSTGGGGGGYSSEFPEYIKAAHGELLANNVAYDDHTNFKKLDGGNDLMSLLNDTIGNSPFASALAYDPATRISTMESAYGTFDTGGDAAISDFETYLDSISTTTQVETELAAFDAGMRNINAVHSSAFALGRQIVASGLIETKLQGEQTLAKMKLAKKQQLAQFTIEAQRMAIVALREQSVRDQRIDEKDALWDISLHRHSANLLAASSGGTETSQTIDGPSEAQSALGGALAGAGVGAQFGGPIGAGIGAAVGGIAGLL